MADEQTKTIPVSELSPGDILASDVGIYDDLKSGTLITEQLLDLINKLPDISEVTIVAGDSETPADSVEQEPGSDQSESTDIGNLISSRIEAALSKKVSASQDNLQELSQNKNIDLSAMDKADQGEAINILNFVEGAKEDIQQIESGPKLERESLYGELVHKTQKVDNIYSSLLSGRAEAVDMLEQMVGQFINETGPNRDASLLLKDVINHPVTYLANHCLNVAVVSIATAIELTKLMENLLNDPQVQKDMGLLQKIRNKTFDREELTKLGYAAFVHDIYFKKVFPNLKPTDRMDDLTSRSHIEKHPSESYHLLRKFDMDYHVNRAVLQHHERMDGTGFPDGITGRMFSKYTAVMSFADRYVSLTQPNPFSPVVHPTAALKHMLSREKAGFDNDVLISFAHASTMVPIGSWVALENGQVGYACTRVEGAKLPLIRVVMTLTGEPLSQDKQVDPNQDGFRIKQLLMHQQLVRINEKYLTFYIR